MSLDGAPGPAKWTYLRYSGPYILAVVGAVVGVAFSARKHLGVPLALMLTGALFAPPALFAFTAPRDFHPGSPEL